MCSIPRLPVSHTQAVYVIAVNYTLFKRISGSILVAYGSATDVGVLLPIGGESDRVTSCRNVWLSKTQSLATLSSLIPCARTVLRRVGHVEGCCKSPARTTTGRHYIQSWYDDISKASKNFPGNLGSCHLSLLNGGTGYDVSIQLLDRVR